MPHYVGHGWLSSRYSDDLANPPHHHAMNSSTFDPQLIAADVVNRASEGSTYALEAVKSAILEHSRDDIARVHNFIDLWRSAYDTAARLRLISLIATAIVTASLPKGEVDV